MKKNIIIGLSLVTLLSGIFAQSQMTSFKGTTDYKQGMSLEDAGALATVSQTEAITTAQTRLALTSEPLSTEITVLDGFIVWRVDMGSAIVYVDVSNAELSSLDSSADPIYASSDDDDGEGYDDDDDHDDYESSDDDYDEDEASDDEDYEDDD